MRSLTLAAWAAVILLVTPADALASPKRIIAVFDVETSGLSLAKAARDRLGDYLVTKVAGTGAYQVVPRAQLRKRLRRQKRESYKACYDQSCQIEVGRELAAQKSLSTKILRLGKQCVVTLALFDLRKSATEKAADATGGCGIGALVRSLESAVLKLTGPVGGPAAPRGPIGVVDRKHCPAPGARRLGEPHPEGRYIYCVDKKGVRQGPMISWHANGRKAALSHYRDNKLHGLNVTFHRNGSKSTEQRYVLGKRHGRAVRWDREGNRTELGQYKDNVKVGTWTRLRSDGNKYSEERYKNDDKHGPELRYHSDGSKASRTMYQRGSRHGPYVSWNSDGKEAERGQYQRGKRHGVWHRWWSSTHELTTYRAGKKHGPSRRFRRDELQSEGRYRDDKKHGVWIDYGTHRGQRYKRTVSHYRDGKLDGLVTSYRHDGAKTSETEYRAGKRQGRHVSYTLRGDKAVEGTYHEGKQHGTWRYFSRGLVSREVRYDNGQRR